MDTTTTKVPAPPHTLQYIAYHDTPRGMLAQHICWDCLRSEFIPRPDVAIYRDVDGLNMYLNEYAKRFKHNVEA